MEPPLKVITCRGGGFRGMQKLVKDKIIVEGSPISFEREADNAYDPNAIKAILLYERPDGEIENIHVCYVAASEAAILAPCLDQGNKLRGVVTRFINNTSFYATLEEEAEA